MQADRRPRRRFLLLAAVTLLGLYGTGLAVLATTLWDQAIADAEHHARVLTRLLASEIEATAPLGQTLEHLDQPGRRQILERLLRPKLERFEMLRSRLYDRDGRVVYSDDGELTGRILLNDPLLRQALAGATVSRRITPDEYKRRYGSSVHGPLVETYLPLAERTGAPARYVFEGYQDFGPATARLWRILAASATVLALGTVMALGILIYAYWRIHRLVSKVETLEGLLPICASCKKIRVEDETRPPRWVPVEEFFGARDRVEFSHGMCPACVETFKAELGRRRPSARRATATRP